MWPPKYFSQFVTLFLNLGLSPAHLAIQKDRRDILACLLDLGCDANSQEGKSGRGALSVATELGHGDMVDLLLSRGANVNSQVSGRVIFKIIF